MEATFGNASYEIWDQQSEITALVEFGHFDVDSIVSAWDADVPACIVTRVWTRLRWENDSLARVKIAVYDASDPNEENWTVEAVSPEIAISDQGHHDGEWCSVGCSLPLTAGKKALALISYDTSDAGYGLIVFYIVDPLSNDGKVTADAETAFNNPLGDLGAAQHKNWCLYAEYLHAPSHVTPGNLYAPVDAVPVITNERNATGYASGHDARYALDNSPDTWWTPDDRGTNSLHVDLGAKKTVDALALWLHNYNEAYNLGGKTWQIAFSEDDVTYISLDAVEFDHGYRAVVLSAFEPTAARYWRVTFGDFDADPVGPYPEVSAVWVLNGYPLPWSHQRPESNKRLYRNNVSVTRSGHRFSSSAGVGGQRVVERRFDLTDDAGQWANLLGAYKASRGGNLPVVIRTEFDSDAFYAVTFDSSLAENRFTGKYRKPRLLLREMGFERVPYSRRTLTPVAGTLALWRFRGGIADSSSNGYDWSSVVNGPESYERGILEQGNSVVNLSTPDNKYIRLDSPNNLNFNMGTEDFSLEAWVLTTTANQIAIRWSNNDFNCATGGFILGVYDTQVYTRIGDGSVHDGSQKHGPIVNDGKWHLLGLSVSRTNNAMRTFVDGDFVNQRGIAAITGDIKEANEYSVFSGTYSSDDTRIDEMHVVKGHAFTDAEVAARYAESVDDYGTWGM